MNFTIHRVMWSLICTVNNAKFFLVEKKVNQSVGRHSPEMIILRYDDKIVAIHAKTHVLRQSSQPSFTTCASFKKNF